MVWENKNIKKPMQNDSAALKNSLNAKSYYVDVFSDLIWKSHTKKGSGRQDWQKTRAFFPPLHSVPYKNNSKKNLLGFLGSSAVEKFLKTSRMPKSM